ncbi:hypothetical protein HLH34_03390 [Gluconacetobacter azotocaptans]|uniref:Uncharacterized protein n=1 Tax=Gluconacetobacter azotocaptans TaxID=142834 RepID=A0A7W4JQD9_9PROT|nr:hypothetical protein [Gluconacetobacter azotocaptans]MBB2189009.1 hypothetical protein [Gluconacetobacter azotocaptans]GBQ32858.1 hypothetical protein AA13594_2490 [Gluconacetobacter azotocaptans DSM 13594]
MELTPVLTRRPVLDVQDAEPGLREGPPPASRQPPRDAVIRGICIGFVLSLFLWAGLFGLVEVLRHLGG